MNTLIRTSLLSLNSALVCRALRTSRTSLVSFRGHYSTQSEPKRSYAENEHENGPSEANKSKTAEDEWKLIYRYNNINTMRGICRMKLYQTVLVSLVTPASYYFYTQGSIELNDCQFIIGLNVFACTTLFLFGNLFRKVIGIVYINENKTQTKIAHLSFWGKRIDTIHNIEQLTPIPDSNTMNEMFCRIRDTGTNKLLYYINLKKGTITDRDLFFSIFGTYGFY